MKDRPVHVVFKKTGRKSNSFNCILRGGIFLQCINVRTSVDNIFCF